MGLNKYMSKVIEFKNVHFRYTSDDILKCVSFDINSGDFVSIIGSNGAGKSTILKLILGELHQYMGSIKFNRLLKCILGYRRR